MKLNTEFQKDGLRNFTSMILLTFIYKIVLSLEFYKREGKLTKRQELQKRKGWNKKLKSKF